MAGWLRRRWLRRLKTVIDAPTASTNTLLPSINNLTSDAFCDPCSMYMPHSHHSHFLFRTAIRNCSLAILQGSNATGDCCSKCWNSMRQKEGASAAPSPIAPPAAMSAPFTTHMDVEPAAPTPMACEPVTETPPAAVATTTTLPKKKKKKKTSYKNMIGDMMKESGTRDAEMDKESIRNVTGGGAFSKIDKI